MTEQYFGLASLEQGSLLFGDTMVVSDFAIRYATLRDPLLDYDRAASVAAGLVAATRPGQFMDRTPCPGWSVSDVVNHLVETVEVYGEVAAGSGGPVEGEQRSYANHAESFPALIASTRAAFSVPGYLTAVAPTPIGPQPGCVVAQHVVNELIMHSWDLARGTGQDADFLPDLADASIASWQAFFEVWDRQELSFNFGPEQPAGVGACPADRLAAYLGRVMLS